MVTPLKKIYLSITVLSVLIAGLISFWLYYTNLPFILSEAQDAKWSAGVFSYFFRDLDHDGVSEFFEVENNTLSQSYNLKIYHGPFPKRVIIGQYNFNASLVPKGIKFQDMDGDGFEEVFIFTNDKAFLYLSVLNARKNRFVMGRQRLLAGPEKNRYHHWDIEEIHTLFSDTNNDGKKELIFTVQSGISRKPRGIFIYDLNAKKMLHKFYFNAGAPKLLAADVTGDGQKEFIVSTYATCNFDSSVRYTDRKSWLFVFDKELHPLFKPLALGGAFSSVTSFPFISHSRPCILSVLSRRDRPLELLLIDAQGKIILRNTLPGRGDDFFTLPSAKQKQLLVEFSDLPQTTIYNDKLNPIQTLTKENTAPLDIIAFQKIVPNGPYLFFCTNSNGFYIKDTLFQNQAFLPWKHEGLYLLSFAYNGKDKIPQIAICTNKGFHLLSYLPNPLYGRIPYIFIFLSFFLFALIFLLHSFLNQIKIYISHFIFSLKESDNAIILLNHSGKILSVNNKVGDFLKMKKLPQRGQNFIEAFKNHHEVVDTINKAINAAVQIKNTLAFEKADKSFVGQITVTPFTSYFKFINAYLIEIKDSTKQVMMERQKNWQRNVRKMVHDIKNPLAGIQLKMQTLYLKLIETQPNLPEDLKAEFELAYSELKRIHNISKSFLQFSDLDKLKVEELSLQQICENSMAHFKSFCNEYFSLSAQYAADLPQTVRWDARQIELLLHIILENAIDAMGGKGKISIAVTSSSKILHTSQPFIQIKIADTGPGIAEKNKNKIFEPHFSTKNEGSGMGLVFAKQIVHQHGGTINFYSDSLSGTVFVITLPVTVINTP